MFMRGCFASERFINGRITKGRYQRCQPPLPHPYRVKKFRRFRRRERQRPFNYMHGVHPANRWRIRRVMLMMRVQASKRREAKNQQTQIKRARMLDSWRPHGVPH